MRWIFGLSLFFPVVNMDIVQLNCFGIFKTKNRHSNRAASFMSINETCQGLCNRRQLKIPPYNNILTSLFSPKQVHLTWALSLIHVSLTGPFLHYRALLRAGFRTLGCILDPRVQCLQPSLMQPHPPPLELEASVWPACLPPLASTIHTFPHLTQAPPKTRVDISRPTHPLTICTMVRPLGRTSFPWWQEESAHLHGCFPHARAQQLATTWLTPASPTKMMASRRMGATVTHQQLWQLLGGWTKLSGGRTEKDQ